MTESAYTTIDDRRLWSVNQLIGLDRDDLAAEVAATARPRPAHGRTPRRRVRLRRWH